MSFTAADHVTEREVGPWQDCTFASMLEVVRGGFPDGGAIPATVAEKEALRAAAGLPDNHGGATIAQAVDGATKRYGMASAGWTVTADWSDVRAALGKPDALCVVQGSMAAVPAWLRRWDTSFTGAHSVAARGATWCDPLAPKGTYAGEPVPVSTWEAYFRGLPGAQAFITEADGLWRDSMAFVINLERWLVKDGTPYFDNPRGKQIGTILETLERTTVGIPLDYSADGHDFAWRAIILSSEAMDGTRADKIVYIPRTALGATPVASAPEWDAFVKDAIRDPDSWKDTTPYSQAQLDAAYAKGKAEGDVQHTVTLSIDGKAVSEDYV